MSRTRDKPPASIDENALLRLFETYQNIHRNPPTADELYERRGLFAPTLSRIDTLRMWLYRHTSQNVLHRVNSERPFRYIITRIGLRRIKYLEQRAARIASFKKEIDQQFQFSRFVEQLWLAKQVQLRKQEENEAFIEILKVILGNTGR